MNTWVEFSFVMPVRPSNCARKSFDFCCAPPCSFCLPMTESTIGCKAPDCSIAIKAEEKGFDGGILTVIMGYDTNGTVTGIWVDASTQTKGIGSNVSSDDFLAQFDGMDGTQNIVMNQDYDAYSGATISSTALFAAINDCVNCYNELA